MVHSWGKNSKLRKTAFCFVVKSIFLGVFIFKKKISRYVKKIFYSSSIGSKVKFVEQNFCKICIYRRNFNYLWQLRSWFLTIFGVKKVIFRTFSKLFWRYSWCVRVLFLDLKCPVLAFFCQLERLVYDLQNLNCESKFDHRRRWFLTIFWVKKEIFGTFSKLLRSFSGCVRD